MTEDLDLDAAEYVLGTLDHVERADFASRLPGDPDARRAVFAWESRLSGLADRGEPVSPSADVWPRIERAIQILASNQVLASKPIPFKVIDGGGGTVDRSSKLAVSRNRWRAGALLSGSVAAALLVLVGERQLIGTGPDADGISYVAAVNRDGTKPALLIRVDMKTRQVFVRPVAAETPAGHSLELWYIGDQKPPRSMGVVDQAKATLAIPRGATATDATFAVSVEPEGGSKTGGPTGAVVYSGQLIKE